LKKFKDISLMEGDGLIGEMQVFLAG